MPKPSASKSPRKQLSGHQKRQRAIQKAAEKLVQSRAEYESPGRLIALDASSGTLTEPVKELPVYGVPPPKYVAAIESILIGLEQGQFNMAAQLADSMLRDSCVYATLGVRVDGFIGSRLDLEPAMDTARARRIKEDAEEILTSIFPLPEVAELLRSGILMGVGIAQIVYKRDGKSWTPTIKVFHNKFLRYDWSDHKYKLITADGEITIEPGDKRFVVFEPYGQRGWLRCLMRAIAIPWLIHTWCRSWWARYAEVHGQPIRLGIIPADADPADEKRFLSQLSNLAHEASIRLRQGEPGNQFDVKLLEAIGRSSDTFTGLLTHCEDSIAIAALGQSSSTTGGPDGKLNNAANPGEAVRVGLADLVLVAAPRYRHRDRALGAGEVGWRRRADADVRVDALPPLRTGRQRYGQDLDGASL